MRRWYDQVALVDHLVEVEVKDGRLARREGMLGGAFAHGPLHEIGGTPRTNEGAYEFLRPNEHPRPPQSTSDV